MTTPKVTTTYVSGDRWYVDDSTGDKAVGVSAVVGMMPKPALPPWAAKMAAEFVVKNLGAITALAREDEKAAIDLIKGAPWRKSGKAANSGTEVHAYAEGIARAVMAGTKPTGAVPREVLPFLKNYVRFFREFDVEPIMAETTVWNRETGYEYAGTFDLMARLRTIDDALCIIDTKTGASGIFAEAALQQTAYQRASHYIDPETGEFKPMPKVERVYALWLRGEGWALKPLESTEAEWEQFRRLRLSYEWKRTRAHKVVGKAINASPYKKPWSPR